MLALCGLGINGATPVRMAASRPAIVSTHAIYAAFTLNLTRFITWPPSTFSDPDAPFVIGTLPRDPINEHLDAAARTEKFGERPIRTIRIRSLEGVDKCHAIFLSHRGQQHSAILARAGGRPILTIGDAEGFLELGGHVRFVPRHPHAQLRISVENLKASGLSGRSQLLRLASQ